MAAKGVKSPRGNKIYFWFPQRGRQLNFSYGGDGNYERLLFLSHNIC
jgi:hypothetical protein